MSHPFGDLVTRFRSRKHGLSQNRLAEGIGQAPAVISDMCRGKRLTGLFARERVLAIIRWFYDQDCLSSHEEANQLLAAAQMVSLNSDTTVEATLLATLQGANSIDRRKQPTRRRDDQITPAKAVSAHQLEPPPQDFTGRQAELSSLIHKVQQRGVRLIGLFGLGGIGKTSLALKLAAEVALLFPDIQIMLDFKGNTAEPLSAADALRYILRTLDQAEYTDATVHDLRKQYLTALHNRKILFVADNMSSPDVAQLLIPPTGSMLLLTSRVRFALPGLLAHDLPILAPEESQELLLKIAPRIDRHAQQLAEECGHLPLALRIVGSNLAAHINLEPARYLKRLANPQERLELIDTSIALSYESLDVAKRALWRTLSVIPGPFGVEVTATIWGTKTEHTEDFLSELVRLCLLEWNANAQHYRMHDLVRLYAANQLHEQERIDAEQRLAEYTEQVISVAVQQYQQGYDQVFEALALFDHEWHIIQAGQHWVHTWVGQQERATQLAIGFAKLAAPILDVRLQPTERLAWFEPALAAARLLGDTASEAEFLAALGDIYYLMGGHTNQALQQYDTALDIFRHQPNQQRTGDMLGNIGLVHNAADNYAVAREYFTQHLHIAQAIGDQRGENAALNNLGMVCKNLGEYPQAIEYFKATLPIAEQLGDTKGLAATLNDMGNAYLESGQIEQAITMYDRGLTISRKLGDQRNQAALLTGLGEAYAQLGQAEQARQYHEEALNLMRESGDRQGEGIALFNLGVVYESLNKTKQAVTSYQQAINIADQLNDRRTSSETLWHLSQLMHQLGEPETALRLAERALQIFREIHHPDVVQVETTIKQWRI